MLEAWAVDDPFPVADGRGSSPEWYRAAATRLAISLDHLARYSAVDTVADQREAFMNAGKLKVDSISIAPMLSVRRGGEAVAFYKAAFGAHELFRLEDETGAVVARLSVGGAEFWLADESPSHSNFSPESLGGSSARMIMTVKDPDAAVMRAVSAGAREVWPVGEQHGWVIGRVVDPFGHHWEIGRPTNEDSDQ